jgi:hypothetical protein
LYDENVLVSHQLFDLHMNFAIRQVRDFEVRKLDVQKFGYRAG